MKPSIREKLDKIVEKSQILARDLADPNVTNDMAKYQKMGKEAKSLSSVVDAYEFFQKLETEYAENQSLLEDEDSDISEMAQEECVRLKAALEAQLDEVLMLLIPKDEDRAGAGGQEAALFVLDLLRMYQLYAQDRRWKTEVVSHQDSEQGGAREVICHIKGNDVFASLKFESGTHRVQRVPVTEAQGRIHTSTCTVAILPESDEISSVDINPQDLRIDTYRSSGAGGQHVNTTDSAVRITHIPTGVVVECQDERSQHKNKAKAMKLLSVRILDQQRQKQQQERSSQRKSQVGSGDRSERIRTYNFQQGRVTDHRINLTLYQLEEVLNGQLDRLVEPLHQEDRACQLGQLDES